MTECASLSLEVHKDGICDKCHKETASSNGWDFIDKKYFRLCRSCDRLYMDWLQHTFTERQFNEFSHTFLTTKLVRKNTPLLGYHPSKIKGHLVDWDKPRKLSRDYYEPVEHTFGRILCLQRGKDELKLCSYDECEKWDDCKCGVELWRRMNDNSQSKSQKS